MICAFSVKNLYCFNAYYLDFKYRAVDACFSPGYRAPMIFGLTIGHTGKPTHPTSKGKCGRLPPSLQAQWFNNVPPEMVGRRTPALWRCSKGHIWIDTKEARQTLKGFDKCFECQHIVSVSGPNLSKF
jgi:hypothetical protein